MNAAPADSTVHKWPWTFWLMAIAAVLAVHVVLIFIFGTRRTPAPLAPLKTTPSLALASGAPDAWLALNSATLFALPDRDGFAGLMWEALPPLPFRRQNWTEDPHWLAATNPLPVGELGVGFNQFMQTNRFSNVHLEFYLPPPPAAPIVPAQPLFAQSSTLQVEGVIRRRPLLNAVSLPSWPFDDVIAPSIVQVLVDAAGNVVSATLLPPENDGEAPPGRDPDADERALEIARNARFAPIATGSIYSNPITRLSVGRLIFNWQTVPKTTSNGNP